jgi:hypothetical protein
LSGLRFVCAKAPLQPISGLIALLTRLIFISLALGLFWNTASVFAQDAGPIPAKRHSLIDLQAKETVTELLQRQETAEKNAKMAKARKLAAAKAAKNKSKDKATSKRTLSTSKPNKTAGEVMASVHPIAIPNRIEVDAEAVPLRLDAASSMQISSAPIQQDNMENSSLSPKQGSKATLVTHPENVSSSRGGFMPVSDRSKPSSVPAHPADESLKGNSNKTQDLHPDPKGFIPASFILHGPNEPNPSTQQPPSSTTPDVLPLRAPSSMNDGAPPANASALSPGATVTSAPSPSRWSASAIKGRVKDWMDTPRQPLPDRLRDVVDSVVNTSHEPKTNGRPIGYEPISGIAIFPVLRHGGDKAFGDLPLMFATEYAAKMASKTGESTKVYNPVYTMDKIRQQGLGPVYDQIMAYYSRAGRPEPNATEHLLKEISEDGKPITRLMFVESDVDFSTPDTATGFKDHVAGWLADGTPKDMKAMVRSRVQIFNAETPELPRLWGGTWQRSVIVSRFRNMTKSVYDDTDSEQVFGGVSRRISQELFYIMPREAYMVPVYDQSVHARILQSSSQTPGQEPTTIESSPLGQDVGSSPKNDLPQSRP